MSSNLLKYLNKAIFDVKYAKKRGISPRMLAYFVKKGFIARISHGIYALNDAQNPFDLKSIYELILIQIPQGVIGRMSALKFFDLTDEDPGRVQVIVPTDNVPKRKIEDVEFFLAPRPTLKIGIEKKGGIRVTSIERTLIECLRTGVPLKTVLAAFELAQQKGLKPSLSRMNYFARLLRTQGKFRNFREAIL